MLVLSGRRSAPATIPGLSRHVPTHGELYEILDQLPYMAMVLTSEREAVHANRMLLDVLGLTTVETVLAKRPGELLECIHSRSHAEGCGGAEGCRHCQAWQVVTDCLASGRRTVREVRLSARAGGRLAAYDLKMTATPLELHGQALLMVFFEDISAHKRREHLEGIFLHDLLNSVSGLQLLAERLQHDPAQVRPAELARQVQLLTDEIRAQQLLLEAERGELTRNIQCVPVRDLIADTLQAIEPVSVKRGVELAVDLPQAPVYLATDALLARRVLLNAVKNAVEAIRPGGAVKIGAVDGETVAVTVWNAGAMAESTRHQVFQRSFSTKGKGRGLGTYSMRLLMENYLGGTVAFTSDAVAGTTFTLSFPSMRSYLANTG